MSTAELNVRVTRKTREAAGIFSFELSAVETSRLPGFEPGAHIDVHVPGGPIRQYSLYSLSSDCNRYEIAVLREPASRGGSVTMHEVVDVGHILRISPPRNHFPLGQTGGRPLLLAGGIGVTPILCMAEKLSVSGSDFQMHYWSRTASRTAFLERAQRRKAHRRVRLRGLHLAVVHVANEIRQRHGLAELLYQHPGPRRNQAGFSAHRATHRIPLRALRRASGPRFRRRAGPDGRALVQQRPGAEVHTDHRQSVTGDQSR